MRFVLLALVAASAAFCQTQRTCPWMNAASAAGFLDGAVNVTVARPDACEFQRQKRPVDALRIEVGTRIAISDKCTSKPEPLKAIGNEAVACSEEAKDGQRIEWVIGSVRDQQFAIRISTNDSSATSVSLREKARKAAEQVAGNLF